MRHYLPLVLALKLCSGQQLFVYSPLTRLDPAGEIVKADRGSAEPRHILSPGIPRNASTPLRVVVRMEKPDSYFLDIGQNPEDAVKARLYKELFIETPAGWIPDALQEVNLPYRGTLADFRLPDQKVVTFWLDMFVDRNAPPDRIKVEPQLYVDSMKEWIVYPMEVRVQEPVIAKPATPDSTMALPPPTDSADHAAFDPLRRAMCGSAGTSSASPGKPGEQLTNRELLRKYVQQDLTLAKNKIAIEAAFRRASGTSDVQRWCGTPSTPSAGPEWYLRFRDILYRDAGAQ